MSTASMGGGIMTIAEVAAYLRISQATVYRLAKEGQIPASRVGRLWRFRRDAIDEWFEQQASASDGSKGNEG
jgi:excisionase family DNA binding protein